jgi:membrane associated rhomboid family serine protease
MLSDRHYMRGDYQRERTSVLTWLICAIVAGFVIELVAGSGWMRDGSDVIRALGLNASNVRAGSVWTLLTHSFLHDPNFILHVVGNLLALFLLGRELLPMLGSKRFLGLYAAASIVGGLFWVAVHWHASPAQMHLGATAAVDALFIVYACFFPNQELDFLFLFLFRVTVKPKYLAGALVLFDLVSLIFWEIPGVQLPYDVAIASSAHLGGMLTGFAYYWFVYDMHWFGRGGSPVELELPRWLKRQRKITAPAGESEPAATSAAPEDIRAEIDRILDKINSHGFAALTPAEKQLLSDAREQLTRR